MSNYATEHAGALADIRAAGQSVTFTKELPGTKDAATETFSTPSTVTVTGAAVRVKGDRKKYESLSLLQTESPTLLFAADTLGQLPPLGARVSWGGLIYSVRDIDPVDPNGTGAIIARIIVSVST